MTCEEKKKRIMTKKDRDKSTNKSTNKQEKKGRRRQKHIPPHLHHPRPLLSVLDYHACSMLAKESGRMDVLASIKSKHMSNNNKPTKKRNTTSTPHITHSFRKQSRR
jgi:hypothetical protein